MLVDMMTVVIFAMIGVGSFVLLSRLLGGSDHFPPDLDQPEQKPGPAARFLAASIPQMSFEIKTIEKELRQSGRYERYALQRYLASRNAFLWGVILLTAGAVFGVAGDSRATFFALLFGMVLFALAYGVPRLLLQSQAASRVTRIQHGLPDALDMIGMSVTGGLPLAESLPHVSQEIRPTHPDVARELEIIQAQAEAGSMGQSLRQFAQRIDAPDIRSLAAIVGQTERLGTNVALALRDYADNVRRARRQRAEARANTLSIKMLFPVILCLAPPVYIVLCGPPILQLGEFLTRSDNRAGELSIPPLNQVPSELE